MPGFLALTSLVPDPEGFSLWLASQEGPASLRLLDKQYDEGQRFLHAPHPLWSSPSTFIWGLSDPQITKECFSLEPTWLRLLLPPSLATHDLINTSPHAHISTHSSPQLSFPQNILVPSWHTFDGEGGKGGQGREGWRKHFTVGQEPECVREDSSIARGGNHLDLT